MHGGEEGGDLRVTPTTHSGNLSCSPTPTPMEEPRGGLPETGEGMRHCQPGSQGLLTLTPDRS